MTTKTVEQRLQEVEDRVAIKAIVDTFSNLADKKDFSTLVKLLTEDADARPHAVERIKGFETVGIER